MYGENAIEVVSNACVNKLTIVTGTVCGKRAISGSELLTSGIVFLSGFHFFGFDGIFE